jgi:hypothetical protein
MVLFQRSSYVESTILDKPSEYYFDEAFMNEFRG